MPKPEAWKCIMPELVQRMTGKRGAAARWQAARGSKSTALVAMLIADQPLLPPALTIPFRNSPSSGSIPSKLPFSLRFVGRQSVRWAKKLLTLGISASAPGGAAAILNTSTSSTLPIAAIPGNVFVEGLHWASPCPWDVMLLI
ncbi:hypothetical protein B0H16DRAFT_1464446 [Mycena metata]|uniref:Uncharacterized protein n=1 Tax=Mycena metata TaxID=1033252 RepID=A0AAD7IG07_9AGAR|nr:hypothetical protein B0H16DRAFT_1464446 [Mycena metata]